MGYIKLVPKVTNCDRIEGKSCYKLDLFGIDFKTYDESRQAWD